MRLALYQPEIPQNTGTLLRLAACMGVPIDLIGPLGFVLSDRHFKRAGMDYIEKASFNIFSSWHDFCQTRQSVRYIALCPRSKTPYTQFQWQFNDVLLLGRESSGLPSDVMSGVTHTTRIPQVPNTRSLNIAVAASMILGEALRQMHAFDENLFVIN